MHKIGALAEALKLHLDGMDLVAIGNCVLFDAAEGWHAETVSLK